MDSKDSPTSVLFVETVEAQEQTVKGGVDDYDWDPELAKVSLTEFRWAEALDATTRRELIKVVERFDEVIPWDEWVAEPVVKAEAASLQDIKSRQVPNIILEVIIGRRRSILRENVGLYGMLVREPEIGMIKKRRYVKRGDGTRRHGRPPDHGPYGLSTSWNTGVYPGRGPALISRADMIILPQTTPSAFTFKDSATVSVGVSGHSAAGDTETGIFLSASTVNSTPGPATSTAIRNESSKMPPNPHSITHFQAHFCGSFHYL
jgi:hypothetical protein